MSGAIDYAGWAYKQGSKIKNWKKRFFVLRGRELIYYASQSVAGRGEDEKGRVVVVGVEEAPPEDGKDSMLLITCERKSTLLKIKPLVAEEAAEWRIKIDEAIAGKKNTNTNTTNRTNVSVRASPPEDPRSSVYASRMKVEESYASARQSKINSPSDSYEEPNRLIAASPLAMDDYEFDDNQEQHAFAEERLATGATDRRAQVRTVREGWVSVGSPQDKLSWKKRFAILTGTTLAYYVSKGAGQALETVRIIGVALSRERPNTLDLRLDDGRTLGMAADSREDLMEWERAVAAVLGVPVLLRAASSRGEPALDVVGDDASRPSSYTGVFCEGWLMQKRNFGRKDWERRYFVLNGAMLHERDSPTSQTTDEGYVTHMTVKNDASIPEFEVELMSGRTLLLHAENTVEAEKWIHALSDLVGKPSVQAKSSAPPLQVQIPSPVVSPMQGSPLKREDIYKMGWLLKKGSMIKSWKRRYFVLNGDTLQYFEKASGGYALGSGIIFRVVRNTTTTNSLDVHFLSGRILRVSAKEKHEVDAWFDVLKAAAELIVRTEHTTTTAKLDAAVGGGTTKNMQHGWLLKRGQMLKNWKRRYFTLQRNRLTYYDEMGGELLGAGVVFDVAVGNQRPLCIDIRFQNGRLLHVVAADDQDFKQWYDALTTASDISGSFLSQKSMSQDDAGLDNEFDFDVIDEDGGDDLDSAPGDFFDEQELLEDDKDGYGMWEAAMNNKPDFDRSDSWDSEASDHEHGDTLGYDSNTQCSQLQRRGSDASSIPDEPRGCSGWLNKEGGNVKTWKRRYFTLHGVTLKYFKSASGSLLRSCEIAGVEEMPSVKFGLSITLVGGRRLVVSAESKEEYEKWLLAIWGALADNRASLANDAELPGVISITSVPSSPVTGSPNQGKPNHSGWLEKEGQRFKTWKKRYFTLKNGVLMYFNDIGGVTQGHGSVIAVEVDQSKPNTLRILLGKDRIMRVIAPSQAEMSTWYAALASSCKASPRGSDPSDGDSSETESGASSVTGDRRSMTRSPPASPATTTNRPRVDTSDYLKNDTITNDSFIRIRGTDDDVSLTNGSFHVPREFKGDLTFTPTLETPEEGKLARLESDDDLEYLRGSTSAADLALLEKMRKKKEEDSVLIMPKGCAPCCQIM